MPSPEQFESKKDSLLNEEVRLKITSAFNSQDKKEVYRTKKAVLEEHPEETQAIETAFGLIPALRNSESLKFLDSRKDGWEKVKQTLKSVTEYNFLLTDLVHQNIENRQFLSELWRFMGSLATDINQGKQFEQLKRGILSQVAAWRVLEETGSHPKLSHPTEDAFDSIDLWTEKGEAVQVKGAPISGIAMIETDSVAFPGVTVEGRGSEKYHINGHLFAEAQKFQAKVAEYGKAHHENIRGYFMVVPYESIDFTTGEPDQKVIEEVKAHLPDQNSL
ncbi:MAG: hypothetical protein Q7R86_00550 [bacterium]|nr:hypothetical protein [bacterium]